MHLRVAFLPFVQVIVKTRKPSACPEHPATLGQHLKRRRIQLGLHQKQVAERLGLDECTIANWEKDRTCPAVRYLPRLIGYLEYNPLPKPQTIGEQLRAKRQALGLSCKRLARMIGVDGGMLQQYEHGNRKVSPRHRRIVEQFLADPAADDE